jgi:hypothetical protein
MGIRARGDIDNSGGKSIIPAIKMISVKPNVVLYVGASLVAVSKSIQTRV